MDGWLEEEFVMNFAHTDSIKSDDSVIFSFFTEDTMYGNHQFRYEINANESIIQTLDTNAPNGHNVRVEKIEIELLDSLNIIAQNQMANARSLIRQVRIEMAQGVLFTRFDSLEFQERLWEACKKMGVQTPDYWGIYDQNQKAYKIHPAQFDSWDYEVPLFQMIYWSRIDTFCV